MESDGYLTRLHDFANVVAIRNVTSDELRKAKAACDEIERGTRGDYALQAVLNAIANAMCDNTRVRAARSLKMKLIRLELRELRE